MSVTAFASVPTALRPSRKTCSFSAHFCISTRAPREVFSVTLHGSPRVRKSSVRGIRVSQNGALVGSDGIDETKHVGLIMFETPMYEMGVLATQILMDLIELPASERKAKRLVLNGDSSSAFLAAGTITSPA